MRVLCHGGSLDRQVFDVYHKFRSFKKVATDHENNRFIEETYNIQRGSNGSETWCFAVLAGVPVTDQMAIDSQPMKLTEREQAYLEKTRKALEQQRYDDALHFVREIESALTLSREF